MGIGKLLAYTVGGAVLGVGAIAAAPFTGGGSLLGAATLASSLAGAGAVAAGTAAVAGGTGAYLARKEDEEDNEKDNKIAKRDEHIAGLSLQADKFEQGFKQAIERLHGDKEYFNYIIGLTAIGISMACVDGEISEDEKAEIEEFIGGVASSSYPEHIKEAINLLYENKPNFQTAIAYLQKIDPIHYPHIRSMLELIMLVDNFEHEREKAFLQAFDSYVPMINYVPETDDTNLTCTNDSLNKRKAELDHVQSIFALHQNA